MIYCYGEFTAQVIASLDTLYEYVMGSVIFSAFYVLTLRSCFNVKIKSFKNEGECFLTSKNHYQTEPNNCKCLNLLEWLTTTFCIQFKIMVVLTILLFSLTCRSIAMLSKHLSLKTAKVEYLLYLVHLIL